ncbi:GyrI-like domain-containing protein [Jeotgalibacillus malaysiensis]|uniref:GyrI-like domain-containing protein n=1 Tax=Jeotgalibacillus malaysiensis TaxID=1508404 RepID=UPI003850F072
MNAKIENATFHLIGLTGKSLFKDFGHEVPSLASKFLGKISEIPIHTGIEAGIYEPYDDTKPEGIFHVGVLTGERPSSVPDGFTLIEVSGRYAVGTGKMDRIREVHQQLNDWIISKGHIRMNKDYIIETYHPEPDGERVTVYLPLQLRNQIND